LHGDFPSVLSDPDAPWDFMTPPPAKSEIGRAVGRYRDLVEVITGLTAHDHVIDSAPETLQNADIVCLAKLPRQASTQ
jgi:hypothetical protein